MGETHSKFWTDDRVKYLRQMVAQKLGVPEMCQRLGRSEQSVINALGRYRIRGVIIHYARPVALVAVKFPRFEDVEPARIAAEWPPGKLWNWRHLVRLERSEVGNSGMMCAP